MVELSNDPEALSPRTDVDERQFDDIGENRRGTNTQTQSSRMSVHFLMSSSPHLSSSRELWKSSWQDMVHVPNRG